MPGEVRTYVDLYLDNHARSLEWTDLVDAEAERLIRAEGFDVEKAIFLAKRAIMRAYPEKVEELRNLQARLHLIAQGQWEAGLEAQLHMAGRANELVDITARTADAAERMEAGD